jgi:DNA-binding CsgD family transcriptional regulator
VYSERTASDLIGLIYDAAGDLTLWTPLLKRIAQASRATSAAFVLHDFKQPHCTVSSSWEVDPGLQGLYEAHYHDVDVWAQRGVTQPAGTIVISQAVCPLAELRTTEIYNDLFVQSGIEHAAFAILESNKSGLAGFSFYRDRRRPEFTSSDLHLLEFLAPHLQRAFKLHFHISELKAHTQGLESALHVSITPVILLTNTGQIAFVNHSAAALIAERDGLLATRCGLQAEQPAESNLLTRTIVQAASTSKGNGISAGGTILVSRRNRPPLHVLISPIHQSALQSSEKIAAVAFVNDPLRRQRPDQAVLRALYGLTPAECRVALLLGDGHAPRQIANTVGVTENTVRSQIKSVFSKTGVKRQGELIRLLVSYSGPTIEVGSSV